MNEEIKEIMFEHGVDNSRYDSNPRPHPLEYDLCIHPRGDHPRIYVEVEPGVACVGTRSWETLEEMDWFVRPRGVRELVSYARERDWYVEGNPDDHLPTVEDFM